MIIEMKQINKFNADRFFFIFANILYLNRAMIRTANFGGNLFALNKTLHFLNKNIIVKRFEWKTRGLTLKTK
jgi:hypothetical protein